MRAVWMVRAGHGGIYAQLWRESRESLGSAGPSARCAWDRSRAAARTPLAHHKVDGIGEFRCVSDFQALTDMTGQHTRCHLRSGSSRVPDRPRDGGLVQVDDDRSHCVRRVQWYGSASRDACLQTRAHASAVGTMIFRVAEDVAGELRRAAGVQGWEGRPLW